jgi:hypothetical protein
MDKILKLRSPVVKLYSMALLETQQPEDCNGGQSNRTRFGHINKNGSMRERRECLESDVGCLSGLRRKSGVD